MLLVGQQLLVAAAQPISEIAFVGKCLDELVENAPIVIAVSAAGSGRYPPGDVSGVVLGSFTGSSVAGPVFLTSSC